MREFKNLPGTFVIKEDGNLQVIDTIPGKITLLLGTAPAGRLGFYYVSDTASAEKEFDPTGSRQGTLIKGMYQAIENGAEYVGLYRIGASPAVLDFFNGYTIALNEPSKQKETVYKIYYTNDYDGTGVELLRIYDGSGVDPVIVYDSIAKIDTGEITVFGSALHNKASKVITIGEDIVIGDDGWKSSPSFASFKDFKHDNSKALGKDIANASLAANKTITTTSELKAGMVVQVDGANEGYFVIDHVVKDASNYIATVSKKIDYVNGQIVEAAWSNFTIQATATISPIVKYIETEDGLSLSLNDKFLAFKRAYWELESAKIDEVVPCGVHLDELNVVDNEGRFATAQAGYKPVSGDVLGKVYEFKHNGQIFMAFKNSFDTITAKAATEVPTAYELGIDGYAAKAFNAGLHTIETALACSTSTDVSTATQDIGYFEANFAYQLADYLDGLSANDNEAYGAIGVKAPNGFSKAAVSQWLGALPVYNKDGDVVRSGSGIKGNKFMAGSLNVKPGFFRTSNGYIGGQLMLDDKQRKIDIGKYIDVIGTPVVTQSNYSNLSFGEVVSGAEVYAGHLMSFEPNVSTTNKVVKSKSVPAFSLKKEDLNDLIEAKYTVFTANNEGRAKSVVGVTAALKSSDWTNRMTCRIVSSLIEGIKEIADPYIGGISTPQILTNLEDKINSFLKTAQAPQNQYILGGKALLKQSAEMRIAGEAALYLDIVVAGELRRLIIITKLSK